MVALDSRASFCRVLHSDNCNAESCTAMKCCTPRPATTLAVLLDVPLALVLCSFGYAAAPAGQGIVGDAEEYERKQGIQHNPTPTMQVWVAGPDGHSCQHTRIRKQQ